MYQTIEQYLDALKNEMQGSDAALIQDAISDAREHLSTALAEAGEGASLSEIIEGYGSPEETASAYKEVEKRTSPALKQAGRPESLIGRFFGVYFDARTWGSLLYMLIAFVTGIFYLTWAVTGVSLSVSLSIFIFGLPFALLFMLSVRGLALIEGRLVEALLGIRMPRRPLFSHAGMKWLERLKALVTDKATWLMLVYMLVQFALGTIYFTVIVTVLSVALSLFAIPVMQEWLDMGAVYTNGMRYFFPVWSYPLLVLGGFFLLTLFMNLVRGVGQLHGRMAKWMLVSE